MAAITCLAGCFAPRSYRPVIFICMCPEVWVVQYLIILSSVLYVNVYWITFVNILCNMPKYLKCFRKDNHCLILTLFIPYSKENIILIYYRFLLIRESPLMLMETAA